MWPFRRKVRPAARETWRFGDLAECVHDDWMAGPDRRPRRGDRAFVINVYAGHTQCGPRWLLQLFGFAGLWNEAAFRKVVPPTQAEELQTSVSVPELEDHVVG